jgi:signal transduction histidine kinase/ligand-binding sensor domain-containing protein
VFARSVPAGLVALGLLLPGAAGALEAGKRFDQYAHAAWRSVGQASSVQALVASRDGHLWLGTTEGLVRFDGQRPVVHDAQRFPGIADRNVVAVHEARDGGLWIASQGRGLSRLDGSRVTTWSEAAGPPGRFVLDLVETADGSVWAAGKDGVARFLPGRPRPAPALDGLPARCTHALAVDRDGALWAGTHAGLARWDGRAWVAERTPPPASASIVDVVLAEPDGTLWMGTRGAGLWSRRDGRWRGYGVAEGLGSNEVSALLRDRQGHLWAATRKGTLAWLAEDDRFRTFPLPPKTCADRIEALAEDAEGGLWVATELCGLHRLADRPFRTLTTEDGLPSDRVLGLVPHPAGGAVIGTRGGGLARLAPGGAVKLLRCAPDLPCDECWDFTMGAPVGPGFLAVCRRNVVLRWDGGAMSRLQPLPGDLREASFALAARDGALWFAEETGAVVRAHQGMAARLPLPEPFAGYRILFEGAGGAVWVAADDGLVAWQAGQTRVLRLPPGERPAEVANFHEDAGGALWMATKGEGIRHTRGDRLATVGVAQGLPSGWIIQLLEDGQGRLWASSSKGIFWVDKRELEEVVEGRRARVHANVYDANDGIQLRSESFGHPAGFKDGEGRLWFATNGGVVTVVPGARRPGPRVRIEELRLDGQRLAPGAAGAPVVRGGQRDLEATFAAATFAPADTVSFRYRLGGGTAEWVELGASRTLRLARLAPGDYQLSVAARTRESDWSAQPARFALSLRPPFHRSPAFLLVLAGTVGLALLAVHRARLARARAGMAALAAERTRIAREIHDTLAQAFVATSVQLECLEEALEREGPRDPRIHRHLDTAKKVVAESLDEARRAVWVLRPQAIESGLVPALETMVNRVSGGTAVALQVSGPERELPPLVASNLLRVAHEAVANALRHARARRIEVRLAFAPGSVALAVADDGQGLAPAPAHRDGQGILGMKERAAQMAAALSIEPAPGGGTVVRVEVGA